MQIPLRDCLCWMFILISGERSEIYKPDNYILSLVACEIKPVHNIFIHSSTSFLEIIDSQLYSSYLLLCYYFTFIQGKYL